MYFSPRFYWVLMVLLAALGLRAWQEQAAFQEAKSLFPQTQEGHYRVWISGEPEILFERETGSHVTGRGDGSYLPEVRKVRAMCTLLSADGRPLPPVKVRCTFLLSPKYPAPVLSYGEELFIRGKIQPPRSAMNPGQFDYARFLRHKGVAYVLYASPGRWWSAEEGKRHGTAFLKWSFALKRWAQDAFYRHLPFPANALLDGILLGERAPLPEGMIDSFFLTGTIHILAVSGLMTAFVAGILFLVLRVLRVPRKPAAILALLGLALFVGMTGANPPVCRAGLFSALALLAVLLERRLHGGALLCWTAILLVLHHPPILFDLSFQISFLATAGLMVLASRLTETFAFLGKPTATLLATTLAAQVSVTCILAHHFNQLSPYSIPANLLIVPLALLATAAGLVFLAGAAIHPALGEVFGAACEMPLGMSAWVADLMARWPGAEILVPTPPVAWTLLFHALLLATFLFFWPVRRPERPSRGWLARRAFAFVGRKAVGVAWILFLAVSGALATFETFRPQPFRVTFLSVGHGDAIVMRSPEGRVLVVDAGKETKGHDRYNPVVAYLRHRGIRRLEGILNTHPDADHVGGLVNVARAYRPDSAYEGPKAKARSGVYRRFREALEEKEIRREELRAGDLLFELDPVRLEVLHPTPGFRPKKRLSNNRSLVTRASFGKFSLLLPGDVEREGLERLLAKGFRSVDWALAPHHGRKSGEPLLSAKGFRPRFVVVSDAKSTPGTREALQEGSPGCEVLETWEVGAVELEVGRDGKGRYRTYQGKGWTAFGGAIEEGTVEQ